MKVFVTGASGFVGGALVRALKAGGAEVLALSRSNTSDACIMALGAQPVGGSLDHIPAGAMDGCEAVVHAAAHVEAWGPAQTFWQANVEGTRRVLEAARAAGVRRFVHIGTEAAVFDGRPLRDIDETAPLALGAPYPYARTKAHAELAVLRASGTGFETISVRPRLVWGPGDATILPFIREMAAAGRFMWIDGGRALTSTCHVENLAHGVMLALERGRGGEAYFVTDGETSTLRDFLTAYLATVDVDLSGAPSAPGWVAGSAAWLGETAWKAFSLPGQPPLTRLAADNMSREITVSDAKARREIGYRPLLSRAEGLAALASAD
jgi:nucleoside-diphosphate-sugar epimerase